MKKHDVIRILEPHPWAGHTGYLTTGEVNADGSLEVMTKGPKGESLFLYVRPGHMELAK